MKLNTAETRVALQERKAVVYERFRDRVVVRVLSRKIEPGDNVRVLVQARAFGKPVQCAFYGAYSRFELLIGLTFLVNAGE